MLDIKNQTFQRSEYFITSLRLCPPKWGPLSRKDIILIHHILFSNKDQTIKASIMILKSMYLYPYINHLSTSSYQLSH